jgi:hypothetical protein
VVFLANRLGGNTSGDAGVAHDEESVMTRLCIGRLGWLAGVVLLTAMLLLATWIDIPTWTVRGSAVSGRLAALVTCVLPATADDPSSTSANVSDTTTPDCEAAAPDQVRAAWMTAC